MSLESFVTDHDAWIYALIFIWTFFEGETVVLVAGALSASGILDVYFLFFIAWMGSFLGDQCWFSAGRLWGPALIKRFPAFGEKVSRVLDLLHRWNTIFILVFRFIYGIRNVASFSLGLSKVSRLRFSVLNFIAAGIWSAIFTVIGYLAGVTAAPIIAASAHYIVIIAISAAVFLVLLFAFLSRKKDRLSTLPENIEVK